MFVPHMGASLTCELSTALAATLVPYPKTKDSGLKSVGEVPAHWGVRRLRSCCDLRVSNVDKHRKDDEIPVRLCNYVDVYKNDRITTGLNFMRATASSEEIVRFRLRVGDVLVTKDSEAWNDIGVPALVDESAADIVSGYHLALLRPIQECLDGRYLFRTLQSPAFAHQFHIKANGVTRFGLSHSAIKSLLVLLPPLAEQATIVRFLDHTDLRVRRYTHAKQELIKLMEEQKKALIHQAVTGQLEVQSGERYTAYKDSGLEWLPKIPDHWGVVRNGQIFSQRNETGFPELPILEVSLKTGVSIRDLDGSGRKQIMALRSDYKRAAKGDIAYNMMRMWQGAVGVVPIDGLVSPAYVVATPQQGTDPRYFRALFRTAAYMAEVDKYSRGIVKDRNRLYWIDFKQMPSPCPPLAEQVRIADRIDEIEDSIGTRIRSIEQQINLVGEYRTRLIADVVTGKLDVREAAAKLPDEIEGAESPSEFDTSFAIERETPHACSDDSQETDA